jgi:hypothetical protein
MLPMFYTEINDAAEIVAYDPTYRTEQVAFLKARLARGTATPEQLAELMNMLMEGSN